MPNALTRLFSDPGYARYVFRKFAARTPLSAGIFSNASEHRSDSDDGLYARSVLDALSSQRGFDGFKRSYGYRKILEHVSKDQGATYLEILKRRNDSILETALSSVLRSDEVGSPIKHHYDGFEIALSPTTLRYLKVASDLRIMFGPDLGRVAEIGCGYGGQCLCNDQLLSVEHATLFDLPLVNQLIERYLNSFVLRGAFDTTVINRQTPRDYDLVISNYAFSELPWDLQLAYVKKVLSRSAKGYLTMNSGLGGERSQGKLSLDELAKMLPDFEIFEEEPLSSPHNYIIAWGFDAAAVEPHFVVKSR